MTFEQWAESYFGNGVSPPEACRDAWNASRGQALSEALAICKNEYTAWDCVDEIYELKEKT